MGQQREFLRYVIPSVTGMLVSSLYVVVDGIFVGRGIGSDGIAAINLIWPYVAIYIAVIMMISVGGAALSSHALGAGDPARANRAFSASMALLMGAALVFTTLGVTLTEPICRLLGADETILTYCVQYLRWYMAFGIPYGFSMGLGVFVRNDGDPNLAFCAMISGALINLVMDYVAIFPLQGGMPGAAIASGLGQVASTFLLLTHFFRGRGALRFSRRPPEPRMLREVLHTGLPELTVDLCTPVNMFTYNLMLMSFLGATGVAVYGIIAYILTILTSLFTGVSQGIQPLLSRSCGAGDQQGLRHFFRTGLGVNFFLAAAVYLAIFWWGRPIISIFTSDGELVEMAAQAIRIYGLSFLFGSVNIVCITFFLSIRQTRLATFLSFSRGVVLNLLYIFTLPFLLGVNGIWGTITAAEGTAFVLVGAGFILYRRQQRLETPK